METHLYITGSAAFLKFSYSPTLVALARNIPGYRKWSPEHKAWKIKPTRAALDYIDQHFPNVRNDQAIEEIRASFHEKEQQRQKNLALKMEQEFEVRDYKFKTTPYAHQLKGFAISRDLEAFALLLEQGTGKSKIIIDTAAYLATKGKINAVLIIAPNSVKTNWVTDELPIHMPDHVPYRSIYWEAANKTKTYQKKLDAMFEVTDELTVFVMNVEAFSNKRGIEIAEKFVRSHTAMMVVDESSRVKTPGAKRTKNIIRIGKHAPYRRILTGTPVTQNPLDIYAQYKFLDEDFLGYSSFYAFRNRYAIMGGYEGKQVIGFQHVNELQDIVEGYSFRVLKKDCLDLPEKIYQKRTVPLTARQQKAYTSMSVALLAEIDGQEISASIALVKLLRLQQIVGGYVLSEEDGKPLALDTTNPRIDEVVSVCEEAPRKVIIWARFKQEIREITKRLNDEFGEGSAVSFFGDTSEADRITARTEFQNPDSVVQFFVGNPTAAGIGLTLTQATMVIYYSNSFSLEDRLQSEDRAHRIGQNESVTYIDLVAPNTMDAKLIAALRQKKEMADLITKDGIKDWI